MIRYLRGQATYPHHKERQHLSKRQALSAVLLEPISKLPPAVDPI
jgi:hypothetical protein